MSEIFLEVLNTSIAASWVVLAVLIARLLLKKAPRSLVCGLWALVGARLVIGRAWEAPFSLIPSAEVIPPESLLDRNPVIHSGVPIIDRVVNPIYTDSFRADPVASVNPLQVWTAVWANLWILGMIAMLLWALLSWLRIRRQVRESIQESKGVFLCDRIGSPFILGILRPRIYLPSGLDAEAKAHVIAHERAHLARRDHWWKPLGYLLLTINWFNPVLWLAYILLCRDIEMACDERVVRDLLLDEKKAYSAALLRCSISRRTIAACPLAFGEVGVKARIKSVLNYKKPAFWVILVALVLTAVLAVGFLSSPESAPAEIRWNGVLYIQEGEPVDHVPDKQQTTGTLRSVLHDSTKHPEEDGQAVRLGWEYAGQPVVTVGNVLYLEQPGGGSWLPFRLKTPQDFLFDKLELEPDYLLSVRNDEVWEWESLGSGQRAQLRQVLETLRTVNMEPLAGDQPPSGVLSIEFYEDSLSCAFSLILSKEQVWTIHFYDPDLGMHLWQFRSEALTRWAQPYLDRAAYYAGIFAGEFASIHYRTFERAGLALTLGVPEGWRTEELKPVSGNDCAAFRFQPEDRTGGVNVYLYPEEAAPQISSGTPSPAEFPNGLTGTKYALYADRWEVLRIDTTRGTLLAALDADADWWAECGSMAEVILGSIAAYDGGESILGTPNQLGITLSVENVSPNGLTLVCTQDGTPWKEILTGSPWSLEQWTEEGWVNALPESTAWTMEAYSVPQNDVTCWNLNWSLIRSSLEPGTYRISKHFTATPVQSPWGGISGETIEETVYAEFIIE